MQGVGKRYPGTQLLRWFSPFGLSVRFFLGAVSPAALAGIKRSELYAYSKWIGREGFHLVALSAIFVALALTLECIIETQKYRAQNLSGAIISIGLLRELGPLTVSLAWCAQVSAFLSQESQTYGSGMSESDFAHRFVAPRYVATLLMSIPLGAYGLVIGFITSALFAPLIGVCTTTDFLESARRAIQDKDLVVFFVKLVAVNPTIGVFAGCAAGWAARDYPSMPAAANAVTATFVCGYIANLIITTAAYFK